MKRLLLITTTLCLMYTPLKLYAGDINQPTHLPNRAKNKINQVRLLGLTAEDDIGAQVNDQLGTLGIGSLNQNGCNLNVGNSIGGGPGLGGDRDVIIDGDIINFCK